MYLFGCSLLPLNEIRATVHVREKLIQGVSLPKPQVIITANSERNASIAAAMTPCNFVPGRTSHRSVRLSQVGVSKL